MHTFDSHIEDSRYLIIIPYCRVHGTSVIGGSTRGDVARGRRTREHGVRGKLGEAGGGGVALDIMHGLSCMTVDPRIATECRDGARRVFTDPAGIA